MRRAVLLLVTIANGPSFSAQPAVLTDQDIAEAIGLGITGNPEPYALRYIALPGRSSAVIGHIYTPFVRVALASRRAHLSGQSLTTQNVPPELLKPVIEIAFRRPCLQDSIPEASRRGSTFKVADVGFNRPAGQLTPRVIASPLSISTDPAVLAEFGSIDECPQVVLLATYSLNVLGTGHDFVVYRDFHSATEGLTREYLIGRVPLEEVRTWR